MKGRCAVQGCLIVANRAKLPPRARYAMSARPILASSPRSHDGRGLSGRGRTMQCGSRRGRSGQQRTWWGSECRQIGPSEVSAIDRNLASARAWTTTRCCSRAMAGRDAQAFRTLVERHLPALLGIARRMLRDEAEAEDVAQEALIRLWQLGSGLELGAGGARPWLRRVVSNLCIDRIRAGRAHGCNGRGAGAGRWRRSSSPRSTAQGAVAAGRCGLEGAARAAAPGADAVPLRGHEPGRGRRGSGRVGRGGGIAVVAGAAGAAWAVEGRLEATDAE